MTNPEETLPPGFRFHPTDEELILHYLRNRAASNPCSVSIMADVDIYKFDPWDLPGKAIFGDKEWYFFSLRDRKYPNGLRPNRATASGYWKATGTDKPIFSTSGGGRKESIGVKKTLVFYEGKPPRGLKTNWIMHEYRLTPSAKLSSGEIDHHHQQQRQLQNRNSTASMRLDDWVLCRIYQKRNNRKQNLSTPSTSVGQERGDSTIDDTNYLSTFPDVITNHNFNLPNLAGSLSELLENNNYFMLSRFLHDNPSSEISGQKQQIGTSLFPMPAIATSLQKTHLSVVGNGNTIGTEDGFFEVKGGGGGGGYSLLQPSKKYNTSSSFTSTDLSSSMIETPDQCSSSYLSHKMLLDSHLGLH